MVLPLAKYVPTRAELSSLKLCRVQPDLSKIRKAAKITRADEDCRFKSAELRWSLKIAKGAARQMGIFNHRWTQINTNYGCATTGYL